MIFKRIAAMLTALLLIGMLAACSAPKYKDGVYKNEMPEFDMGWKETVEITIKNGEIDKVSWDAVAQDEKIPVGKKQYSKSGLYGMLAGGAQNEWCDQAKLAEDFIMKNGVDAIDVCDDYTTDAIAGCTIKVNELVMLAKECLDQAKIS